MASDKEPIRVALVQLQGHPALKIGGCDFLSQPFIPHDSAPPLTLLSRYGLASHIEDLQTLFREEYLKWSEQRLRGIFEWFRGNDRETKGANPSTRSESGDNVDSPPNTDALISHDKDSPAPADESDLRFPDVIVFPEGGVPRRLLKVIKDFYLTSIEP